MIFLFARFGSINNGNIEVYIHILKRFLKLKSVLTICYTCNIILTWDINLLHKVIVINSKILLEDFVLKINNRLMEVVL